jgi:hypothetical protein
MDKKQHVELKIQIMIYEHLIASMFSAQQRGLTINTEALREKISSNILKVTQAYYQTDQTASQANAEVEAEALWLEVMGNHHTDRMFGLIQAYLQRD